MPAIAVQWVGDMSAASHLPGRAVSFSPEAHSLQGVATDGLSECSDDENGTVKKIPLPQEAAARQRISSFRPPLDLFSINVEKQKHGLIHSQQSSISSRSPLRKNRSHEMPKRQLLVRPRISTETFRFPSKSHLLYASSAATPSISSDIPVRESRRWSQMHQAPLVSPGFRARLFSSPNDSFSSLDDSELSDQEWFTPPSSRKAQSQALVYHSHSNAPLAASKTPKIHSSRSCEASSALPSTLDSRYLGLLPRKWKSRQAQGNEGYVKNDALANVEAIQRHMAMAGPESTSSTNSLSSLYISPDLLRAQNRSKTHEQLQLRDILGRPVIKSGHAQRHAKAATSESSSSLDSLYAPQSSLKDEKALMRHGESADTKHPPSTLVPRTTKPRPRMPNGPDVGEDSPSSVYSRSISGIVRDNDRAGSKIEDAGQSASTTAPREQQHQSSLHVPDTPPSTRSPSNLCSRRLSSIFHRSPHYGDGASSEMGHRHSGRIAIEKSSPSAGDMEDLRQDHLILKQEVAALREEYRVLKAILLNPSV